MRPIVLVLASLIGAGLFVYGAVTDPFALPFQDFDQLPAEVQKGYFAAADTARYLRYGGAALFVASVAWLWLARRRKKFRNSLQARRS
jgi:hypothetical protein